MGWRSSDVGGGVAVLSNGRGAGLIKKPETEGVCSVSGVPCETAVGNGGEGLSGGRAAAVVVVRSSCPMCEAGRGGLDSKKRTRAAVARFRACRLKSQCGRVGGA